MAIVAKQRRRRSAGAIQEARFEDDLQQIVERLSAALRGLIEAIPPRGEVRRAADLEKALDIRSTLAWQVFRAASAKDSMIEAANLPGPAAMKKFFDAALRRRVPADIVTSASQTVDAFHRLARMHAPDRPAFISMLAGVAKGDSDQVEIQNRRSLFRGNSHVWGMQARTMLSCGIIHPSQDDATRGDGLGLRGLIDLRRLRPDARVIVARTRASDNDGQVRRPFVREPLDRESFSSNGGFSLLSEFSSKPSPRFKSIPGDSGELTFEIQGDAVGSRSQITCLAGDIIRGALARYRDVHNSCEIVRSEVRTPCEILIHDVLVHEAMYAGMISPAVSVYSNVGGETGALPREVDRLPMRETVSYLGKGTSVLHTADVPRYVEMVEYALKKVSWESGQFHVYRCRVEYPVLPSSVVVQFDLPEKPQSERNG
jgi:hypothetical protein